jgi:hypothetical protein
MGKEQEFLGTSRRLGPHVSRRRLLQGGLAIGTLALGQRSVLGNPAARMTTTWPRSAWRMCRLCRRQTSR